MIMGMGARRLVLYREQTCTGVLDAVVDRMGRRGRVRELTL